MHPSTIKPAVATPHSSAPNNVAIAISLAVFSWPSVWTTIPFLSPLDTSHCEVSANPRSQGSPRCFIEDNDVQLLYKGPVNQQVLTSIMNVAEEKLRILKETAPLKKRVFYVLVEMIQNSYLHMDKEINLGISVDEDFTILCDLAKTGDSYKIFAGY